MSLFLIHGSDTVSCESKLTQLKKELNSADTVFLNGEKMDWQDINFEVSSAPLFSERRLMVLKDPKDNFLPEKIILPDNNFLVLFFSKELPVGSNFLSGDSSREMKIFKFSKFPDMSIFYFLDLLADGSGKALVELEKLYKNSSGQYIITMVFYLLRRLIIGVKSQSGFAQQKQKKQEQNFSREKIEDLYKTCLDIDFKIKIGELEEKFGLFFIVQKFLA